DHGNGYKTVYAHLHRFARGIHVGSKVKYGQLIGYLGSSGLSTGPHLHFGVIYKNKVVNPDKLTIKSKYVINENEYASFISRYGYLTAMAEEYNSEKIKYTSVSKKEKFN
ncbi:M23 family metallopeptidase, partial [candidate division WOR-3 bacterium]|nr:M23 family metallopeptidase [candidate division WOR-3 bacterium]